MIFRRKKQVSVRRPNIERQQQPVFRYSSNRSPAERTWRESPEELAKQAVGGRPERKIAFTFIAILLILGSAFATTLTAEPKIIVESEQPLQDQSAYEKTVSEAAHRNLRGFSKFTLDRQRISADLRSQYPEITSVDVSTPLFSRNAVIRIAQAQPAVILRNDNGSKFILNSDGVAILEMEHFSGKQPKGLIEINDETNTAVKLGHPALTSGQIAFISELKRQADAKKLVISSANLTGGGGELDVTHDNSKYFVKYNLYEDARMSFGTYLAIKEYLEESKKQPTEYIDVRIQERAYVQ